MLHCGWPCSSALPCAARRARCAPSLRPSSRKLIVVASTSAPQSESAAVATSSQEDQGLQLHTLLVNYKRKIQLDGGTLVIQLLKAEMLQQCTDMLTAAFVDSDAGKMQAYRRFLRRQISEYLEQHIAMVPRTLILAATWAPAADENSQPAAAGLSEASASSSEEPTNGEATTMATAAGDASEDHGSSYVRTQLLIGTAEISLEPSTRSLFWTLNPPDSAGYLCNMTVGAEHRRKGVAKLLIDAVEELCLLSGQPDIYLHARLQDKAAVALYGKAGFLAVEEDAWFVQWLGLDRRYLMRKTLHSEGR